MRAKGFHRWNAMVWNRTIPHRHMCTQTSGSNWRQNGTPEIIVGGVILSALAFDHFLQKQHDLSRQKIISALGVAIRHDESKDKNEILKDDVLFDCIVRRIPKYFDGSKSLMGVEIGDRIGVIKEFVDRDKMYHLCVLKKNERTSVGWFPITCLEKPSKGLKE